MGLAREIGRAVGSLHRRSGGALPYALAAGAAVVAFALASSRLGQVAADGEAKRTALLRPDPAPTAEQVAQAASAAAERDRLLAMEAEAKRKVDAAVAKFGSKIHAMKWWQECAAWGREMRRDRNSAYAEALRRSVTDQGLVNGVDTSQLSGNVVVLGMTSCGAYAVLGEPDSVNSTETASGTRRQHVFSARQTYVYTSGPSQTIGIVDAIQN